MFGGKKSRPDDRDFPYQPRRAGLLGLPPPSRIDRSGALPRLNQAYLNACAANAGAAKMAELYPGYVASRLAIWYAGRRLEGTLGENVGMETRDLMKVLQAGVPAEDVWPYDVARADDPPPASSDIRMIGSYSRITGESDLIDHLAHDGSVILSFSVPSTFAADGTFPDQPGASEGWHCVVAAGYDFDHRALWCANWWGASWGIGGYFWMPIGWAVGDATGNDMWAAHLAPPGTVAGVNVAGAFVDGPLSPP